MTKRDITYSNWVVTSPRHRPGTVPVILGALTKSKALVGMVSLVLGEETALAQRNACVVTLIMIRCFMKLCFIQACFLGFSLKHGLKEKCYDKHTNYKG